MATSGDARRVLPQHGNASPQKKEAATGPPREYALHPLRGALVRQAAGGNSSRCARGNLRFAAGLSRTSNRRN
jgi:hypothetical protein